VEVCLEQKHSLNQSSQGLLAGHGFTKGDLIQFYLDISDVLLPHLAYRAMVMSAIPMAYQAISSL